MKFIEGGITAPLGFKASGVACGLKKNGRKDMALIYSEVTAKAAGVFTTNLVKGHSLKLSMENIKDGIAQAVVINSGNANACVGEQGDMDARIMAKLVAEGLKIKSEDVLAGSTGVIGMKLDMEKVKRGIAEAVKQLSGDGGHDAEEAIMTTDLIPKECSVEFNIGGRTVKIGGMAKGSGMIHPNMATMIGVITSDINIDQKLLHKALKNVITRTFNRVSVDGDTSVCDKVLCMANGLAGNGIIEREDEDYGRFVEALETVCTHLSRLIAKDGEGATKLIEISVRGALTADDAYKIVCAVAKSPLVKTAMFGEDANWGRILTAAGYSGASFDPGLVDVYIGDVMTCRAGTALSFDEGKALAALSKNEVSILIDLNEGDYFDRMWTCDFSYDYVKINGSYRT